MSFNIDNTQTLRSTLRISKENAAKAKKLELPEGHFIDDLKFGEDGYAPIPDFAFYGEGSGNAERYVLRKLVALTEGEADLIFTWAGGEAHSGLRIRDGKMTRCDVVMTLAPEKPAKGGGR